LKTNISTITTLVLLLPAAVAGSPAQQPSEQEFLVTAYYSPEPGQCCYVRGGYEADKILNGEGHTAADGTAVYAGIAAAPSSYPFGTRIMLPGIGTVAVHDRGGAIVEREDGIHRLDIWMGAGEEGLARALAFGAQRVRGTVYPVGIAQPATSLSLASLPAPAEELSRFGIYRDDLMAVSPAREDRGYSVQRMQEALQEVGLFSHAVTAYFGDVTEQSLGTFIQTMGIDEPSDQLTTRTAAYLTAAVQRADAVFPVDGYVDAGSSRSRIAAAQRLLRFMGVYRGRTNGTYDDQLRDAVFRFQKAYSVVTSWQDAGAGRIGPQTKRVLEREWNRRLVAQKAEQLLAEHRVGQLLADRGAVPDRYLSNGDSGTQVRLLQSLLAERGYFVLEEADGYFGPRTEQAVLRYQQARGIVERTDEVGAGMVGPRTLATLQLEQRTKAYRLVRAEGWEVF